MGLLGLLGNAGLGRRPERGRHPSSRATGTRQADVQNGLSHDHDRSTRPDDGNSVVIMASAPRRCAWRGAQGQWCSWYEVPASASSRYPVALRPGVVQPPSPARSAAPPPRDLARSAARQSGPCPALLTPKSHQPGQADPPPRPPAPQPHRRLAPPVDYERHGCTVCCCPNDSKPCTHVVGTGLGGEVGGSGCPLSLGARSHPPLQPHAPQQPRRPGPQRPQPHDRGGCGATGDTQPPRS